MSPITQKRAFLRGMLEHRDRLSSLLGEDWPAFQARLEALLEQVRRAPDDAEVIRAVDEIVVLGLSSPAADLFRELMRLAADAQGTRDATRLSWSIPAPRGNGKPPAGAAGEGSGRASVLEAARELSAQLSPSRLPSTTTSGPAPRYLNTLFAAPGDQAPIPPERALVCGRSYALLVNISPERAGLGEEDVPFPAEAVDALWENRLTLPLLVVVTSRDFTVASRMRTLELPKEGPSPWVRFDLQPLESRDRGFLQVELFYRGYLLQSRQVEAQIVASDSQAPLPGARPAQTARTTFAATARLAPDAVATFPSRVLTIDVERDPRDNSLDVRFLDRTHGDAQLAYYDTHLQPQALGQAIEGVRRQLDQVVRGEQRDGALVQEGYEWKLKGDDALLNVWLPLLARAGRNLYRILLPETQGHPSSEDQGERLRAALQPEVVIQVNPVLGNATVPWSLLYERPVKYIRQKSRVCDRFATCGPDCAGCPSVADPYTVCPHAFWGYRYAIEQLPCWVSPELSPSTELVRQIDNGTPLYLSFNVWPDFNLWSNHVSGLKAAGKVEALVARSISELEEVWGGAHSRELDVVYFYCHGGVDEVLGQPFLEIGDGRIDSGFLDASALRWPHQPLVFLNGCATGHYGPESYLSLIDDFRKAGASGVVGTECPVSELFAEAYARALFPRLFRRELLGRAMLDVRREFLHRHKNPLGLLYSLYAAHEITLARGVAEE